jgi:hypothetical protein
MKSLAKSLALGCVLLACSQAWAVHRCTGPDGAAVFQDLPCAGKGQEVTVKPASGGYDQAAGDAARARLQAARTRETAENIERLESMDRTLPAASRRRCPSSQEIRNMETGASSITLSRWERAQRQEQIREARSCGY